MRKITFLLSLFLTMIGAKTASAQDESLSNYTVESYGTAVTSTNALDGTGWFLIRISDKTSRAGYICSSSEPAFTSTAAAPATGSLATNIANYLFKVAPSTTTEGCFTIYNGSGVYLGELTDTYAAPSSTTAVDYNIALISEKDNTNYFYCQSASSNVILDTNGPGSSVSGWSTDIPTETSGNNSIQFIPVELAYSETFNVTYNVQIDGKDYTTVTQTFASGDALTAITVDYTNIADDAYSPELGTILTEATTVTVDATEALPFTTSTSATADDATWYIIDMHSNMGNYIWQYVDGGTDSNIQLPVVSTKQTVAPTDAYLWCFTGNLLDGFSIYNKATGTSVSVDSDGATAQLDDAGAITTFKLVKSTAITDAHCFLPTNCSNYLNHQTVLKGWSATDAGSSCRFVAPSQYLYNFVDDLESIPESAVGAVGTYAVSASAFATEFAAVKANLHDLSAANALAEALAAANLGSPAELVSGGYYRVVNAQTGLAMKKAILYDPENSTSNIQWNTVDNTTINAIFQIENAETSGKYVIKNCNTGTYIQGVAGALGTKPAAGGSGEFSLSELAYGQYAFIFGNGTMHANGHGNGTGTRGNLVSWTTGANDASAWYIIPATDVEVALTAVGDATYATAYMPFPVSAVSDGTTMWTANAISTDQLYMTEQTAIPAETGVVLVSESQEATATLTIGDAEALSETNLLSGSTMIVSDPSPYLVLGVGNDSGTIGFYAPSESLTSIGANKAFLNASEVPSSAIALNFGGNATAIESAIADKAADNAPIYDLSGRAVLKTVKGSLYIQGSKKFIAK